MSDALCSGSVKTGIFGGVPRRPEPSRTDGVGTRVSERLVCPGTPGIPGSPGYTRGPRVHTGGHGEHLRNAPQRLRQAAPTELAHWSTKSSRASSQGLVGDSGGNPDPSIVCLCFNPALGSKSKWSFPPGNPAENVGGEGPHLFVACLSGGTEQLGPPKQRFDKNVIKGSWLPPEDLQVSSLSRM
jgi:hypothetical protein